MSPRRSLRASSGRADRGAQPIPKTTSPRSSGATRSLSSEEIEGSGKPQPRRTRSSQEDTKAETVGHHDDEEDEEGEEEVTRCICGNMEYPGMPVLAGEGTKSGPKSTSGSVQAVSPIILPEDAGGLFIQCDVCKVWQHGGCVGIMEEAMSPEEYFCEQCRKELHKIKTSINGYGLSISLQTTAYQRLLQSEVLPVSARTRLAIVPIISNTTCTRKLLKENQRGQSFSSECRASNRQATCHHEQP